MDKAVASSFSNGVESTSPPAPLSQGEGSRSPFAGREGEQGARFADEHEDSPAEHFLDRALCGDALHILPRLPESLADMVFIDPPYFLQLPRKSLKRWKVRTEVNGVDEEWDRFGSFEEYDGFLRQLLTEVRRVMKPKATLWVIGTYHNIHRIGAILQDLGYWILNDVIWFKSNAMPNWLNVRFTNATETLIWAVKDRSVKGYTFHAEIARGYSEGKLALNLWRIPLCNGRERLKVSGQKLHPTQKPEALLERVIAVSTNPGDVVLDPLAGTGTTGVVAKRLGRRFVLIEREERYVEAIERRLEEETNR